MEGQMPNTMNLDLNLGPVVDPLTEILSESETMNLEEWLDGPARTIREVLIRRAGQRLRSLSRQVQIPAGARNMALELIGGSNLQTGEGSASAEERTAEVNKTCDNNTVPLEDVAFRKKEDDGKGNGDDGSFFDCNICLDMARDPVVTCCGHLFCWTCLYRWLHVHSDAMECPVCKGEVTSKNVTPIYGRGNNAREVEEDSGLKIPLRPPARRVESWRQAIQRTAFTIPMEEMLRRLGNRFDLTRDVVQLQPQNPDGLHESPDRSNSLLSRILTSRGMRREQNTVLPSDDVVNLTQSSPINSEARVGSRFSFRRSNLHRSPAIPDFAFTLNSSEWLVEGLEPFQGNPLERNQEQAPPVDDTDSFSSIAAVIHAETQTLDSAGEMDSTVSLSTSSSRRRNDALRAFDVDSGESRVPRRRRLN